MANASSSVCGQLFVRIVPRHQADRTIRQLAQRLAILVLVPTRPHAQDRLRRPALLDHFARQQHRVVQTADHEQNFRIGGLCLRHFDGKVTRRRIVGDFVEDRVRHIIFRHQSMDAFRHAGAEQVVDMHEHGGLRRNAGNTENVHLFGEAHR